MLYEQIYSERLAILNLSAKKLDVYFRSNREQGINKLNQFERNARLRIDKINKQLQENHIDLRDDIYNQLKNLSIALDERIQQIFVGQNLINKIGIFLIVIGVIAASQYTYTRLNDMLKGICMFALGSIMLVIGEILNRKKPNVFSLGVTSGGIAILYVAMSVSYFGLKILSMYPAIIICLLITAMSFILSLRYNSQTIATFALIGGYLPIFSISGNLMVVCGAMVYFMVLNLFALGISFNKKWQKSSFVGLALNIFGIIFVVDEAIYPMRGINFGIHHTIVLGYIITAFLIYTAILLDVLLQVDNFFAYKYLAVTLGSFIILGAYLYRNEAFGDFQKIYKYAAIINLWFYAIYTCGKISEILDKVLPFTPGISEALTTTIFITETFLIAYGLLRIKRISDLGTKVISYILYFIGALTTLSFNSNYVFTYIGEGEMPLIIKVIGILILIFANLLAVFAVKDLTKSFVMAEKLKVEWYPLIISIFFVLLLTQNLTVQLGLEFSNMIISIIYAVTALMWIVFGFIKKYTFIRRFGLGLSAMSVAKLFLIDLAYLTMGYKIVAYFALGIFYTLFKCICTFSRYSE